MADPHDASGDTNDMVEVAREAYRHHRFDRARHHFRKAGLTELAPDDLSALADSAWWLGRVDESVAAGTAAYRAHLDAGRSRQAASAAIGVAVNHLLRAEEAAGSGWLGRAGHLLTDDPECAEAGYLRYLVDVEAVLDGPDPDAVVASARAVGALGRRIGEPGLVAIAAVGEGRVLVRQGRVADGMALIDGAMVAVLDGELALVRAGNLYCHAIAACQELTDLRRAAHWTEALERWLEPLPAAVVFSGICRVYRAQLLQVGGYWDQAAREAQRVCAELDGVSHGTAAEAHYRLAEIHRLRGRTAAAGSEYHRARALGRDPQPGLALLRLAQGRTAAAAAAIRTALLAVPRARLTRAPLCSAQVEIAIAAGDLGAARRSAAELADTAATFGGPGLLAAAAGAEGAVLLADGDPAGALPALREACRRFIELTAPYESARTRVLLADAYTDLDDADAAERELDAASFVFAELGAVPGGAAVAARRGRPLLPAGLTQREAEVLRRLATGRSNKEIAAALVISDKTVQRHLSTIFAKLGVGSRTAAAAYAFEHGLASAPGG